MKALVIDHSGSVRKSNSASPRLCEVPTPGLSDGEALIRVLVAGICHTDQELTKGYMNFQGIPGHEFVGEVVEVSASASEAEHKLIGKRVVGEINCGCGSCSLCLAGVEKHCQQRTVLGIAGRDGAFAEYLSLPSRNLHQVPDEVNNRNAVFTEPLAAALEILEQVKIQPDDSVLIIGDGKLGTLAARVIQLHGCDPIIVGGSDYKLDILKKWGLKTFRKSEYPDTAFDFVIEASGSPEGFDSAVASLKPRGTLIMKSTYAESLTFEATPLVIDEITIVGSRCGPFEPALKMLEQKLIPVEDLITKVYPFEEAESAFEHAAKPDALKILLQFS